MDWHDRIVVDPKVLVGKPVIKGARSHFNFSKRRDIEARARNRRMLKTASEIQKTNAARRQRCIICWPDSYPGTTVVAEAPSIASKVTTAQTAALKSNDFMFAVPFHYVASTNPT